MGVPNAVMAEAMLIAGCGWMMHSSMFPMLVPVISAYGYQIALTWFTLALAIIPVARHLAMRYPTVVNRRNCHKQYWMMGYSGVAACCAIIVYFGGTWTKLAGYQVFWISYGGLCSLFIEREKRHREDDECITAVLMCSILPVLTWTAGPILVAVLLILETFVIFNSSNSDNIAVVLNIESGRLVTKCRISTLIFGISITYVAYVMILYFTVLKHGTIFSVIPMLIFLTTSPMYASELEPNLIVSKLTIGVFWLGVFSNIDISGADNNFIAHVETSKVIPYIYGIATGGSVLIALATLQRYHTTQSVRSLYVLATGVGILSTLVKLAFLSAYPRGILYQVLAHQLIDPFVFFLQSTTIYCMVCKITVARHPIVTEAMAIFYLLGLATGSRFGASLILMFDVRGVNSGFVGENYESYGNLIIVSKCIAPVIALSLAHVCVPNIALGSVLKLH
jgi:hypothetical protein